MSRRFERPWRRWPWPHAHIVRGVATANAADVTNKDNPITSSNVRVSDVGAQTANVSFDYKIDPAQVDEIKDVCFSIEVQRITDITPIEKAHSSANTIGVLDSHMQHGRFR